MARRRLHQTFDEVQEILDAVDGKVDKETGKGLSTNDYTDAEKAKLAGIEAGAQVNPGSATTASEGTVTLADYEHRALSSDKAVTESYHNSSLLDFGDIIDGQLAGKQDTVDDLEAIRSGAALGATAYQKPSTGIPKTDIQAGVIKERTSQLVNDAGFISSETDPTVPSWAKADSKPSYTAVEVGALPADTVIPSRTSQLTNDSGFLASETDPVFSASAAHGITSSDISGWDAKQEALVSGTNIKTVNNESLLGSGNITVSADTSDCEKTANKVTSLSDSSTDTQYPSAKCVHDGLASKQGTISDLASIRSGAEAGATAYQKPQAGIPASDLASGVIPDVSGFVTKDVNDLENYSLKAVTNPRVYVGECDTAAGTAAKVVTVETFPTDSNGKPLVGTMIVVQFAATNTGANATLNVNGTGAASIWYNAAAYTTGGNIAGYKDRYSTYVWDGTYWVWVSHGTDNNDNTLAYNVRYNSASRLITDACGRYRVLFSAPGAQKWVPPTTSTSTNATSSRTVNQRSIDPFGQIVYYASTTVLAADGTPGATALYTQYALTLGYSFNRTGAALTLTAKHPVFIKCAPQSDGSAIIDADNPYVQELPSTDDGKIYIYLGVAYSATAMEMSIAHPVYFHKDGALRIWTVPQAIPTKTSDLTNDSGFLTAETDPTVPSWAKASTKPTYTAVEVGAQPTLVSGTNIKTINGESLLGSGDIEVAAESIDTVEVSVDSNTGTPSATASVSGSTLTMAFHNIKGEKGEKGDQGNSGYSGAAGELEVVNNLTDGGATAALSAEMGKKLGEELYGGSEMTAVMTLPEIYEAYGYTNYSTSGSKTRGAFWFNFIPKTIPDFRLTVTVSAGAPILGAVQTRTQTNGTGNTQFQPGWINPGETVTYTKADLTAAQITNSRFLWLVFTYESGVTGIPTVDEILQYATVNLETVIGYGDGVVAEMDANVPIKLSEIYSLTITPGSSLKDVYREVALVKGHSYHFHIEPGGYEVKSGQNYSFSIQATETASSSVIIADILTMSRTAYNGKAVDVDYYAAEDSAYIRFYVAAAATVGSGVVFTLSERVRYFNTDKTLTIDGMPADAKATGDRLAASDTFTASAAANIHSICHRGYNTVAPENTLPAFKLARRMGFQRIEFDVQWTSDDVPVILHDASINRTARNIDGSTIETTVNIADITYAQALEYDFGIWKGYPGTPIPTFAQTLALCRNLGLLPYIELKGTLTEARVHTLVDMVRRNGMRGKETWISLIAANLPIVHTYDPDARVGLLKQSIGSGDIAAAQALKGDNEVFIGYDFTDLTSSVLDDCSSAGIPVEVFTPNTDEDVMALDPYVTGVISDVINAGALIYFENL